MTWRGAGHEYIRGQTAVWEWGHGGNDRHHTQLQHDINLVLLPSTCNYLDFAIGSKSKRERKSQVSTSSIFKSLDLARKYEPDSDRIWRKYEPLLVVAAGCWLGCWCDPLSSNIQTSATNHHHYYETTPPIQQHNTAHTTTQHRSYNNATTI